MFVEDKTNEVLHLYDVYSNRVLKFIYMITNDYHKAEDLTHDTFLKVSNSLHKINNKEKIETWIFQVAHNTTIDYIRRNKFNILEHLKLHVREKEVTPSTESIMIINENFKELYNALRKLKPTYREVIVLRKIEELSIKETGEILGWSDSKVKSTLSRALKALHKELTEGGFVYEKLS
ncbi:RNA polymerase sigma factor [Bacillus sp. SCS-151]|uniref:RNA polymerase sigma factor n=1 Tax=Nanhaiella sioensis TaxID=3115293 RepID=UPI003979CE5E